MAVTIFNGGIIKVNSLRNNSFMSQGKNVTNGWSFIAKSNHSVGQISGNLNWVPSGSNIINDPDLIDAPQTNSILGGDTAGSNLEVI
ncbi:hypothetical protein [Desulfoscipio gibsoniae]|uniref:Spore germination protein gerPA/gerPF n=1 Tax=Desulfoscipio gibsoniae DSM 7213 TaxID=767817 RepID=R4KP60_9FIRM|nr:hypothetical protein [Desulfoscipio gibsoniae]AGL02360.1 hypothetical protein Desgi_2973 [Desulfoscipio gibsoniae DSM 7213]